MRKNEMLLVPKTDVVHALSEVDTLTRRIKNSDASERERLAVQVEARLLLLLDLGLLEPVDYRGYVANLAYAQVIADESDYPADLSDMYYFA